MFPTVKIHSTSAAPPCHRRLCVVSRCVCVPFCQNTQYFCCSTLSQKAVYRRLCSVLLCLCSFLSKYTVLLLLHPVTEGCVVSAVSVVRTVKIHSTSTAPPCHRRLCVVSRCVCGPYCQNTQYFCCSTLSQTAVWCPAVSVVRTVKIHSTSTAPPCHRRLCVVSRCVCGPYCQNTQYFCCSTLSQNAVVCLAVSVFHTVKIHSTSTAPPCHRRLCVVSCCVLVPYCQNTQYFCCSTLSQKVVCSVPLCLCSFLSKYTVLLLLHPVTEDCVQEAVCSVLLCLCSFLSKYTVLLLLHPVTEGCV